MTGTTIFSKALIGLGRIWFQTSEAQQRPCRIGGSRRAGTVQVTFLNCVQNHGRNKHMNSYEAEKYKENENGTLPARLRVRTWYTRLMQPRMLIRTPAKPNLLYLPQRPRLALAVVHRFGT